MNLFDALHESHELQRAYGRKLTRVKDDAETRELLFLQYRVELEAHKAAEERYLYAPLLMTDGGLSSSRHALSEHHEIEELIDQLAVRDKSGSAWLERARKLSETVRHHLKEEETKFFKVAGRLLSDTKKAQLARQYARDLVRMRKHYAAEFASVTVSRAGLVQPAQPKAAADPRKTVAKVPAKRSR